jgi:hypothetical protein
MNGAPITGEAIEIKGPNKRRIKHESYGNYR